MNNLTIPPPPNWYESNVISCAPDNTVVYGSRSDVVIIHPSRENEPSKVNILYRCHKDRVIATGISPGWNKSDKLALSVGADKVISLIDVAEAQVKNTHSGHRTRSEKVVGATFAGYDKIISVSEEGFIIIWKWATNELKSLSNLLGVKPKVTCLSACPHVSYIIAFGVKKGVIFVADLRKSGQIMHKIRGHATGILSMAWCPVPYNVFPAYIPSSTKDAKREIFDLDRSNLKNKGASHTSAAYKGKENPEESSDVEDQCDNAVSEDRHDKENDEKSEQEVEANASSASEKISGDQCDNAVSEDLHDKENDEKSEQEVEANVSSASENISGDQCDNAASEDRHDKENDEKSEQEAEANASSASEKISGEESNIENEDISKTIVHEKTEENCSGVNIAEEVNKSPNGPNSETNEGESEVESPKANPITENEELEENEPEQTELSIIKKLKKKLENTVLDVSLIESKIGSEGDVHTEETDAGFVLVPNPTSSVEVEPDANKEKMRKPEYLLASCARGGRSIIIWRALTDGIKHLELNIPNSTGNRNRQNQYSDQSWLTLCWVAPKVLLSSSMKGELIYWNFYEPGPRGSFKWRIIHNDHSKLLFSIAAPIKVYNTLPENRILKNALLNAWTVGKDRYLLNTELTMEAKTLNMYPTIGGSINCLSPSPTYPNKIAVGAGEGALRIWDLSKPHTRYIVMSHYNDRLQQKIISVAWHPTKETLLAFGTIDGRIGLINPCNYKPMVFLVQYGSGCVHKLEWGPCKDDPKMYILYAVVGGQLIGYDIEKPLDAPTAFPVDKNISQLAWKPDYTVCILSTKQGALSLYSNAMKLITSFYIQNKTVHSLAWHPQATIEDESASPFANWLAVATTDIVVYDCAWYDNENQLELSERVVTVLKGHSKTVECLSWSTFEGGKLASAGSDGTVMVWNVKEKCLIHTCRYGGSDFFLSVLWSPLDRDHIITGSSNCVIQIWKLSEHPPLQVPVPKPKKTKRRAVTNAEEVNLSESMSNNSNDIEACIVEIEKQKKVGPRTYVLSGLIEAQNRNLTGMLLEDCQRLYELHYGKGEIGVVEENANGISNENIHIDPVKIFGNEKDLEQLLSLEVKYHSRRRSTQRKSHISLWQGDLGKTIKQAIKTKTIDSWLLSLSASVSHELYLETCEAYAKQLADEVNADPYEIVSYYLACHKIQEAVDTLCTFRLYVEALVLAKSRLLPNDPHISQVLEKWAAYSSFTGCFEIAAQCYIVMHRLEDAVKVLSRRNTDLNTARFCCKLATHSDNKELLDAMTFRLSLLIEETESKNLEKEKETLKPLLSRAELEIIKNSKNDVEAEDSLNNVESNSKLACPLKMKDESISSLEEGGGDENERSDEEVDVEN